MGNSYKILGISENAEIEEVKVAFQEKKKSCKSNFYRRNRRSKKRRQTSYKNWWQLMELSKNKGRRL